MYMMSLIVALQTGNPSSAGCNSNLSVCMCFALSLIIIIIIIIILIIFVSTDFSAKHCQFSSDVLVLSVYLVCLLCSDFPLPSVQTMSCCWTVLFFQLSLLKCAPSQVQLGRSIYLQYVITLSFLPRMQCSLASFLLDVRHCSRDYRGMLGEMMDIMLWGNSTCSHASAHQGHFHWVASQKRPHA